VAERVVGTSTTDACATRFAAAPLENTSWLLTHLGPTAIASASGQRNQPNLMFRADPPTFSGSGGCNRVAGHYDRRGDALTLSGAGTLMACVGGNDTEAAFATALHATRAFRILGRTLELYSDRRQLLATFEAK
jgi:putative lipoprotein